MGHHTQACATRQAGTWTRVHNNVQNVWKEVARLAKIDASVNPNNLPSPAHTFSDKHANILFLLCSDDDDADIVGDVSLAHPFVWKGRGREKWGNTKPLALQDRVNNKNQIYNDSDYHQAQSFTFLPLVATTLGRLNADSVALCYLFKFAHCAAIAYFHVHGWTPSDDE
eukprot:3055108-Rhodomonas_salina.1